MIAGHRSFDLVETMRFDPIEGVLALDIHVARMKASAAALGFAFDRHEARNELHAATFRLTASCRVRLRLARSGVIAVEASDCPPALAEPLDVALVPLPAASDDARLAHSTSDRSVYADARRDAGTAEILFVTPEGLLTKGSFTDLFVRTDKGPLVTPPLAAGLPPGVLRASLIEAGEAFEAPLTPADLGDGFLLGNALRGLMPARLACTVAAQASAR